MDTFIDSNFSGFINFCVQDSATREKVLSSKDGIEAIEKVQNNFADLARSYVLVKRGTVEFSSGTVKTLIANEIVKRI